MSRNRNSLSRECPSCKISIIYKYDQSFYRARKENRVCNKCRYKLYSSPNKGKHLSDEIKKKISVSLKGKSAWNKGIPMSGKAKKKLSQSLKNLPIKMSSWNIGRKASIQTIRKLQLSHKGKQSSMAGKNHSPETRYKIRRSILNNLKNKNISPRSNPVACKFIDDLNCYKQWNLQHAGNGGEIEIVGYLLDGYDEKRGIVFEYDEPRHHLVSKKKKDIQRQIDIFNYFRSIGKPISFWRYDERYKNLYEVFS